MTDNLSTDTNEVFYEIINELRATIRGLEKERDELYDHIDKLSEMNGELEDEIIGLNKRIDKLEEEAYDLYLATPEGRYADDI